MFKKMLQHGPYEKWWNSLSPSTREYLKTQPLWYDRDLYRSLAVGICIGLIVGLFVGYSLGLPDLSNVPITYLKG